MNKTLKKLVYAALCVALALVLPLLTGQIPQVGSMLSPMHIPVLLCGFICGPVWGLAVGAISPLLRSLMFAMPPLFPTATAMAFELAAYGCAAGLLYKLFPKKAWGVYAALICAMLIGRAVWGAAMLSIMTATGKGWGIDAFLAGAFINAWPGIILHVAIIPPIVLALRKAKIIED
ncbi:MAG: ECF transporter S component [Oscillospiraceae bacterium]|nr:ECF transporter S component [Oscillospiraceae bacterium]